MTDLPERLERVTESLLDNESLTADLDDAAAQRLLEWGLDLARAVVQDTAGLDDAAAEAVMSPRLQALRRMLRLASRWGGGQLDQRPEADALAEFLGQAAAVQGESFLPPPDERCQACLGQMATGDAGQRIAALRDLLSPPI